MTPFTQLYRFSDPPVRYELSKKPWVPTVVLGLLAPPFAKLKAVPTPRPGEALFKLEVKNRLIKLLCEVSQPYPIKTKTSPSDESTTGAPRDAVALQSSWLEAIAAGGFAWAKTDVRVPAVVLANTLPVAKS